MPLRLPPIFFRLRRAVPAPSSAGTAGATSTTINAIRLLALLSVVLPLLGYVAFGSYRYQQMRAETEVRLDRALRIAQEHALKVLDTNDAVLERLLDSVQRADARDLAGSAALHERLRALAANKTHIQSIWIWGPDGQPLASSRMHPPPGFSVADRSYFRWHQERRGQGGLFISEMMRSRVGNEPFFDMARARLQPDGSFGGVVSVSLKPEYFEQFHQDLAADEPGLAITMLREDGAIFSRFPPLANAPTSLSPTSPVMTRVQQGIQSAAMIGVSSVDGRERMLAYEKVGDYPVYLGTGMDVAEIRKRWQGEMAWIAAFGLPPMLGLLLASWVALRRSQEALASAQRLQQETEARRRVEEALLQSQKLEALGRLTGGVAHDFNNALMVISNSLVLLKMKHPEASGPYVDSIGRALGSATKLTRQLLAFSRRQALLPEHVSLHERLPGLRDLLAPVLGSRIRLEIAVDGATAPIRVDAAEFELALINLAINARDALGGDGAFTVRARNASEGLPPLLQPPMVVVEAEDNGSGIPPEVLGKVFEPFFTTKPVGEGTGLGLSQVYGLCQRAGGLATVESTPGQGTTVRMYFPPDTAGPAAVAPADQPLNRSLGLHVLLVEDNTEVASALVPLLQALGCSVTHLERATAARDWLASRLMDQLPDVLLTDVVMPGQMDGLALAQQVRSGWPQLRIVVMTGYAEHLDAIARAGFSILPKPCSAQQLAQALQSPPA